MFPLIDAYILMLLQFSGCANLEPVLPPTPHLLPGNTGDLGDEAIVGHGDIPYGMEPTVPQMQVNTSDFIHATPQELSQINFQEDVGRERMHWAGSAAIFPFPP